MIAEASSPIIFESEEQEKEHGCEPVGNTTNVFFFDFSWIVKLINAKPISQQEMSDSELIIAAEKAGTFKFWNDAREDGYNDLLNE